MTYFTGQNRFPKEVGVNRHVTAMQLSVTVQWLLVLCRLLFALDYANYMFLAHGIRLCSVWQSASAVDLTLWKT